ncbi:uncharacterized protein EHS24_005312 [Apiotrichum porosum]|uniref:BTB domain-containing protein n=1 Tax=Apiotrichum porosum TaxID=105984 RepID=A0A427XD13_9TREE|nr:uncharacterized protein EHS24_005312 [Apiotrichum porosum]RSH76735.1 hypothetical protein EHS24_005312 [Apiotrichum porosum]
MSRATSRASFFTAMSPTSRNSLETQGSSNGAKPHHPLHRRPSPYDLTHPYLKSHPNLELHPEFAVDGDVIILCREDENVVGFRVRSSVLRASSGVFVQELNSARFADTRTIVSRDAVTDMHAVLRFLHLGSSDHAGPTISPTLRDYTAILAFVSLYDAPPALRSLLRWHVEGCAAELVAEVGAEPNDKEVIAIVRLAHRLRAEALWKEILDKSAENMSAGWRVLHDPWTLEEDDIEHLEFRLWSLLILLSRVKGTVGTTLDQLTLHYPNAKQVNVVGKNGQKLDIVHTLV